LLGRRRRAEAYRERRYDGEMEAAFRKTGVTQWIEPHGATGAAT
jgi:hypothetical protein